MIKNVKYVKLQNIDESHEVLLKGHGENHTFRPGEIKTFPHGKFLYSFGGKVNDGSHLEIVDIEYTNPQIQDHPIHIEAVEEVGSRFEILDL